MKVFPTKHAYRIHCLVLVLFVLVPLAQAENVALTWQPSDPPADTYRIFQRSSGEAYDYGEWVYQGFETTCVIRDLAPNTTYYFVVRAYTHDAESADSNEVSYTALTYTPDYQDDDTGTSIVFDDVDAEERYQMR